MDARTVITETIAGKDFYLCLGDFLDEFYRSCEDKRKSMIDAPPEFFHRQEELSYLAATVHKLANDYKLNPPDWVFDERCFLRDKPFFGCRANGNLRLLFMYKSPSEFKYRNLFVDENVLKRV